MGTDYMRRSLRQMVTVIMLLLLGTVPAIAIERSAPSTADHSQFKSLQGPFQSGPEVTEACLGCHTEASKQLQETTHWTWEFPHPETGQIRPSL